MEHPFNSGHNLVVFQQLAPIRLGQALFDGRHKSGVVLQHSVDSLLDHLHRILSRAGRDLS